MKVIVVIPVHMGSKRLHGKILMKIAGKTILEHTIRQVGKATKISEIWVCATTNKEDDAIEEFLQPKGKQKFYDVHFMRGDEDDIISRIVWVVNESKADYIINVDGEDLLTDPRMIDKTVEVLELGYQFVAFRGLPLGISPIGFTKEKLKQVYARNNATTEEWWKLFSSEESYSIDTQADFNRLKGLIEKNAN